MMKIYTRTGDAGETSLFGGGRVAKNHLRVRAYGAVDELSSGLGRAETTVQSAEIRDRIRVLQHDLFSIGSHLATPPRPDGSPHPHLPPLPTGRVAEMEVWMDLADEELPPLTQFILPGGSPGAADLHVARTVCRRAEREVVAWVQGEVTFPEPQDGETHSHDILGYLNRLSDLLFVMARLENHRLQVPDVAWEKPAPQESESP
jgi:cob(I)alamin adenosyltransferase